MYRHPDEYEKIKKTVVDIYVDYNITGLPVYEKDICKKLKVSIMPYSLYMENDVNAVEILKKKSPYGFFVKGAVGLSPTIYYNDINTTNEQQRFNIFHEVKHYVFEDEDDEKDDLADFFSRYFMCPVPYLMLKKIDTINEIASVCGVTIPVATNVATNITNRRVKYGNELFDYEIRLIKQLEPVLLEINQ